MHPGSPSMRAALQALYWAGYIALTALRAFVCWHTRGEICQISGSTRDCGFLDCRQALRLRPMAARCWLSTEPCSIIMHHAAAMVLLWRK